MGNIQSQANNVLSAGFGKAKKLLNYHYFYFFLYLNSAT